MVGRGPDSSRQVTIEIQALACVVPVKEAILLKVRFAPTQLYTAVFIGQGCMSSIYSINLCVSCQYPSQRLIKCHRLHQTKACRFNRHVKLPLEPMPVVTMMTLFTFRSSLARHSGLSQNFNTNLGFYYKLSFI